LTEKNIDHMKEYRVLNLDLGFILIFPVWWSSFNPKCCNCCSGEKCPVNYLRSKKIRLNIHAGQNVDQLKEYW